MTAITRTAPETVGTFSTRQDFQAAIAALLEAGFDRADLSALASHRSVDSLDKDLSKSLITLVGELKYEGPLVAAGLIALAAGPVGATIAALIATGVGGAAIKELLDEVSSMPDPAEFQRALEAGALILWVTTPDDNAQNAAMRILKAQGGNNVHVFDGKAG